MRGMTSPSRPREVTFGFVALLATLATLSPFAMDTYIPAMSAVGRALDATPAETQQTLSAYMFGLAIMALWHGAISDALGRRPVVVASLCVYTLASFGCAVATDVHVLIGLRFVQGLAGGGGMIIVRAMIRDTFEGAPAQRLMSTVMLMFSIAPAIAPIIGGWLDAWFGWRSIFWFLFAGGTALTLWAAAALPETLPKSQRQSLRPSALARSYWQVLKSPKFHALTAIGAAGFQTFFTYVGAATPLMIDQLGFSTTQFAWLFVPAIGGFMIGSWISGRVAGRWQRTKTIRIALYLMLAAGLFNVAWHAFLPPAPLPSIGPILVAAIGISLASPATQLMVLDLFPQNRGLAASSQAFAQLLVGSVNIGIIVLWIDGSTFTLALGMLAWAVLAALGWLAYRRVR